MKYSSRDLKSIQKKQSAMNKTQNLTYGEINHIKNKIFVIYAKENLIFMIKNTIKSEIIVITLENTKMNSCSIS